MKEQPISFYSAVSEILNFDLTKLDPKFVNKLIKQRLNLHQCLVTDDYLSLLQHDTDESNLLFNSLSVNYTEFFRNSLTFSVFEHLIIPSLAQEIKKSNHHMVRVWSAACAGGQEAYSIAMLFEEFNRQNTEKLNYRIFATDQSAEQIKEAKSGRYKAYHLDHISQKRLHQWFIQEGDNFLVTSELKKNISFSTFDLLDSDASAPKESIFGDFDIVFCANLLFYYNLPSRNLILEKTVKGLQKKGYLITGETERDFYLKNGFSEVYLQSGIFKKERNGKW